MQLWSALCKTLAEKAAWALATDRGLDLIVMNPATVAGPKSGMNINMDMNNNVQNLLDQSGIFAFIHVDDLASAHILTYQADRAAGRYICFEKLLSKADIVEAANQMYPNYPMAAKRYVFSPSLLYIFLILGIQFSLSSSKLELVASCFYYY